MTFTPLSSVCFALMATANEQLEQMTPWANGNDT
jgi:hypothetical protein